MRACCRLTSCRNCHTHAQSRAFCSLTRCSEGMGGSGGVIMGSQFALWVNLEPKWLEPKWLRI
eukprot:12935797-Prorocentrum_lima.AAC.1